LKTRTEEEQIFSRADKELKYNLFDF